MNLKRLKPQIPAVGEQITLFGMTGTVNVVEPESDWVWFVEVVVTNTYREPEYIRFSLPTDYRTTDGQAA